MADCWALKEHRVRRWTVGWDGRQVKVHGFEDVIMLTTKR